MSSPGQSSADITDDIRGDIRDQALKLGFDAVGFSGPDSGDTAKRLGDYISSGYHGDMGWMETTQERRQSPRGLWPDVKSIIAVGMNYGPDEDPLLLQGHPDRAVVSAYARGRDYHDVLKKQPLLEIPQVDTPVFSFSDNSSIYFNTLPASFFIYSRIN